MKKTFICIIAILFATVMINHYLYSQVFASINGTVKSEDGNPIPEAKVILIFTVDGSKIELTTDKNGRWRKFNLRTGEWTIGFMAEGYEPENIKVTLSAISKNKPIEIRLKPVPEEPMEEGDALYEEGKYIEALEEYQKVLSENPDLNELYDKIGLCYYRLDNIEKAMEAFRIMLSKDPQSRNTLINLGAIYLKKGDLEEGMKYFKRIDESTITDPSIFYNIGILLFKENQIDMSIEYFLKCLNLDPNNTDAYYQLALVYLNKGEMERAKESFQKIIEVAPGSEKAALAQRMLDSIK